MKISFASPLTPDANFFLSQQTLVDFSAQDTRHWFCATAWNDEDRVVGVLTLEPKTWFDWHWSSAVIDPSIISRRLLRTIFRTVFTAGAVRVTALVDPKNEHAVDSVRRLGFQYEGFMRMGIEGNRDALLFGMLEGDCPWLYRGPGFRAASTIIPTDIWGAHHGQLA